MTGEPAAPAAAQVDEGDGDDDNGGWGEPVAAPDQAADDENDIEEGGEDDGEPEGAQDGQTGQGEEADPGTTTGVVTYSGPISYPVRKTGYYCVGEFGVRFGHSAGTDSP